MISNLELMRVCLKGEATKTKLTDTEDRHMLDNQGPTQMQEHPSAASVREGEGQGLQSPHLQAGGAIAWSRRSMLTECRAAGREGPHAETRVTLTTEEGSAESESPKPAQLTPSDCPGKRMKMQR